MRKKILVYLTIIFTTLSLISCQKKEHPVYTCDPELNEWTINHAERFSGLTREELATIKGLDTQMAVYNSLSPDGKVRIWKEKMKLVQNEYGLSVDEKKYIEYMANELVAAHYTNNDSIAHFAVWADQWALDGMKNFSWDSMKVYTIAGTWLSLNEMKAIQAAETKGDSTYAGSPNKPFGSNSCTCYYSISCKWFTHSCHSGGCNQVTGCGIDGTSFCKGLCVNDGYSSGGSDPTM